MNKTTSSSSAKNYLKSPLPSNNQCYFSKKMISLLEGPTDKRLNNFLNDHLKDCPICLDKLNEIKDMIEKVILAIPSPMVPNEIINEIYDEIDEILEDYLKEDRTKLQNLKAQVMKMISSVKQSL